MGAPQSLDDCATITWKIPWTGTSVNDPVTLPDGEFGAEQAVVVQEIQAVNS